MPSPDPLTNFIANAHPLGQEIELVWTLPETMPGGWRIIIFRRRDSDVTQEEIDNYFADPASLPADMTVETVDNVQYEGDLHGLSDYSVENTKQYYYQLVLQDSSDDAVSTIAGANATANATVETKIIDAKVIVLALVERVMTAYGMIKDQHYQLMREYALPGMQAPTIYVTRVGGQVLHRYIGQFQSTAADLRDVYASLEMDNIQVVWEDPNAVRRDRITNIFRESREFIDRYLHTEEGGDMAYTEIVIEGDVINEAVRERVQVGGMMIISCAIVTEVKMQSTLASWLEGEGQPQN